MTPPVLDAQPALAVASVALVLLAIYEALRAGDGPATGAAWDRFGRLALDRGLAKPDTDALAAWARRAGLASPALVLVDRAVFDRYVRDKVSELGPYSPSDPARAARLLALSRLRSQLGHEPQPPPAPLVSSRDVGRGVKVTIRPDAPPTGAVPPGRLVVAHVDEEAIELAPIEGDPAEKAFYEAARAGRGVWAVFGRAGEATYRFRARILDRPNVPLPGLALAHGDFLVKEERRRTPRIVHRVPVRLRFEEGGATREVVGDTIDISWGGAGFVVAESVPKGVTVAFELLLEGESFPFKSRVLSVSRREEATAAAGAADARPFVLNTQFADVSPASRTRLQVFLGAAHRQLKAGVASGV